VTGPPILNCGSCYEACDDGPQGACTTDLCVPTGGGRATCRHFDRARCAEARCQGTLFPGTDATCQGPDIDEDGLADAWEISQIQPYTLESQPAGIDIDCDGLLDEATDLVWPSDQLPEVGKKDVYLQIDFMAPSAELGETESHEPDSLAIRNVVSAFASAGIALHVDPVHRSVPHRNVVYLGPDPEGEPLACRGPAEETMDLYDIKRGSFDPKRTLAYHYALFGHFSSCDSPEDCAACPSDPDGHTPSFLSAGKAEQIGNDLIVSLGGFAFIEDSNSQETKARWEAGTLLHQLGHSLGLEHGGEEKVDFKPNYLSSMNSRYQLAGIPSAELPGSVMMVEARADLSRKALGPLDENALDEGAGLVLPTLISYHARDIASYECPEARSGAAAGAIDWNCNGVEGELLVPPTAPLDLNRDERLEILDGFGDWSHLKLAFQCEGNLAEAVPGDRRVVGELDFATAFQAHLLYAMAHPRLQIRGGTDSSFILLGSPAGVPVTLFGSTEFDVGKIVPSSVRLAGAVPISREIVDKDGDGHLDLLATFRQSSLRISSESRSVALTGYLTSSQAFEAIHAIQIRANPGKSKGAGLRNGGRPACPEPSGACP
jgi:hypothetical protein